MVDSIARWYWYTVAGVDPGPLYLAVTGGLWGVIGLAALIWLWFRLRWGRLAGFAAALAFAVTYWADRLLISHPDNTSQNLLFALGVTLIGLLYVFGILRPLDELRMLFRQER